MNDEIIKNLLSVLFEGGGGGRKVWNASNSFLAEAIFLKTGTVSFFEVLHQLVKFHQSLAQKRVYIKNDRSLFCIKNLQSLLT